MTKKDIRPGMVVEFRNGKRALTVKVEMDHQEKIIFIKQTCFMDLDSYDENLLVKNITPEYSEIASNWDIVKIYDPKQQYGLGLRGLTSDSCIKEFELLWLREKIVEISLADISQKFNIPISQIRIKE